MYTYNNRAKISLIKLKSNIKYEKKNTPTTSNKKEFDANRNGTENVDLFKWIYKDHTSKHRETHISLSALFVVFYVLCGTHVKSRLTKWQIPNIISIIFK